MTIVVPPGVKRKIEAIMVERGMVQRDPEPTCGHGLGWIAQWESISSGWALVWRCRSCKAER